MTDKEGALRTSFKKFKKGLKNCAQERDFIIWKNGGKISTKKFSRKLKKKGVKVSKIMLTSFNKISGKFYKKRYL